MLCMSSRMLLNFVLGFVGVIVFLKCSFVFSFLVCPSIDRPKTTIVKCNSVQTNSSLFFYMCFPYPSLPVRFLAGQSARLSRLIYIHIVSKQLPTFLSLVFFPLTPHTRSLSLITCLSCSLNIR